MFEKFSELGTVPIIITVALFVFGIVGIILYIKKNPSERSGWKAKELVFGAMCIALAFVLSYIRIIKMPQGGSMTLVSMLPIMLFAYIYGTPKGLIVGIAYGLLQLVQDAFVVHWVQLLLDYPIAFGALALAGMFKKHLWLGTSIGGTLRYLAHVLSGVIFFGEYAGDQNVWIYSLGYSIPILMETALCAIISVLPFFTKLVKNLKPKKQ